jgi:hypothetical protein
MRAAKEAGTGMAPIVGFDRRMDESFLPASAFTGK